jgi:hypothetical protein
VPPDDPTQKGNANPEIARLMSWLTAHHEFTERGKQAGHQGQSNRCLQRRGGAIGFVRAASDSNFSDEILDTVRHFLLGKFSSSRSAKAPTSGVKL